MKIARTCLSALAILMACGVSIQAQAYDTLAQLVRVGAKSEWPIATAAFGGSVYFISNGGFNSCGVLDKLVPNSKGKDQAVLVHTFIPYNTSTQAGQAGCNPVGLTVGTVSGTSVLVVTTRGGGVNGSGGLFLLTASAKQEASFPSGVAPVGASIANFASTGASGKPNTRTPQVNVVVTITSAPPFLGGAMATVVTITATGIGVGPFTAIFSFPQTPAVRAAGGAHPGSPAVQAPDGNLYGTTEAGGSTTNGCPTYGCGVVYQLTPPATGKTQWNEHVLYTGGNNPQLNDFYAPVTFDSKGNVYGTAAFGGNGSGGVFMLTKKSTYPWTLTTLYAFPQQNTANGAVPETAVVLDTNGNVYGTAAYGGTTFNQLYGVTFELLKAATFPWKEQILQDFPGGTTRGGDPSGALLPYLGGLYGTTYGGGFDGTTSCPGAGGGQEPPPGCGTVFELTPH
jgi:hypothetical protein